MKIERAARWAVALCLAGCAASPASSVGARPELATAIDPAQAKPQYWLNQPAVAIVSCPDYQRLWNACAQTATDYQFTVDRIDYRDGVMTTFPMVSKQLFEFWRKDSGSFEAVMQNSLQTIRRTIWFQLAPKRGGGFVAAPKVLVERLSLANRHVTAVAEYPTAVSGPDSDQPSAITNDVTIGSHTRYWYAIGRDQDMERQIADYIRDKLPGDR